MIYFTSDTHFGHENILAYDNRPFKDIQVHDETIIRNWNNTVTNQDTIYFLGDFCLGHKTYAEHVLAQLNRNKHFIKGNHDNKDIVKLYEKYGVYLGNLAEVKIEDKRVILCHYAMRVWNRNHHGSYHLYGHSHHTLPDDPYSLSFDVGCNGWNYTPISWEKVKEVMSKRNELNEITNNPG